MATRRPSSGVMAEAVEVVRNVGVDVCIDEHYKSRVRRLCFFTETALFYSLRNCADSHSGLVYSVELLARAGMLAYTTFSVCACCYVESLFSFLFVFSNSKTA